MSFENPTESDQEPDSSRNEADPKRSSIDSTKPPATPLRKCSFCEKPYDPTGLKTLPFCSSRCQQIDLGNWLTERYGFLIDGHEDQPYHEDDESEDEG